MAFLELSQAHQEANQVWVMSPVCRGHLAIFDVTDVLSRFVDAPIRGPICDKLVPTFLVGSVRIVPNDRIGMRHGNLFLDAVNADVRIVQANDTLAIVKGEPIATQFN